MEAECCGDDAGAMKGPEHDYYPDRGCWVHPRCLTCPIPECVFDNPAAVPPELIARRQERARALRDAGRSIREIAVALRVSGNTVRNDLSRDPLQSVPRGSIVPKV